MENATKLSIQIFNFQNFVTEIFWFKVCHFYKNLKIKKWQILNWKISVTKFWKSNFWIDSFVAFSVGYVVEYSIFSVDAVFMEKFATQNRLFWHFSKNQKNADFVRQITNPKMHSQNFWLFLSCSIFRWLRHGIQ